MKISMAVVAVALLTSGAARAGDPKAEVNEQIRAWAAAFNAHDVAALVAKYTDDARFIYTFQGQEGVSKTSLELFFKQSFQATPDIAVTLKSYDVVMVNQNTAVGLGLWEDTFTGPDGKKVTASVHSSEVFVKVGGVWKIRSDHASFVPPPQPAQPAQPVQPPPAVAK